jgi:hypothetical protein
MSKIQISENINTKRATFRLISSTCLLPLSFRPCQHKHFPQTISNHQKTLSPYFKSKISETKFQRFSETKCSEATYFEKSVYSEALAGALGDHLAVDRLVADHMNADRDGGDRADALQKGIGRLRVIGVR